MAEYPDATWPDYEKVVGALLRPLVADNSHIGNLLVDYDSQVGDIIIDGEPVERMETPRITIHERGGAVDPDDFTAFPRVEVACWAKKRQLARDTATSVTTLMLHSGGTEVAGALIDSVEDSTGSEELSLENPDDRCIIKLFTMGFRPQYD